MTTETKLNKHFVGPSNPKDIYESKRINCLAAIRLTEPKASEFNDAVSKIIRVTGNKHKRHAVMLAVFELAKALEDKQ